MATEAQRLLLFLENIAAMTEDDVEEAENTDDFVNRMLAQQGGGAKTPAPVASKPGSSPTPGKATPPTATDKMANATKGSMGKTSGGVSLDKIE